ncbi:galactose-binding domain-like protein [Zychaea mexicana]|uniref:galactose-binding domain-like protein n=1 Tax=Zychaea mexicana TaxID=64656 RepID=UPI0022FEF9CD|nr:galactose-binding domain-like protein [Zychaea mexicana]KAI9495918.1 galactose-binding domain-like protein [Zychaea mexicana]
MGAIQSCLSPAPYTELCAKDLDDTILSYYVDLASVKFDGSVVSTSDEYFGDASNLIDELDPLEEEELDRDGERDGWQIKRHVVDNAWAVVRLGCQGHLYGFDVNTTNFNDAAPLTVTIEAARARTPGVPKWITLLPNVPVKPNQHNFFLLGSSDLVYSQVKLTISPGGGVARLRCYGNAVADWPRSLKNPVNLAAAQKGARITRWTDTQYANDPNILMDHGETSADGWETPHSREAERNDYVVVQLATPGNLSSITVSTEHFLGNAPESVSIDGCYSVEEDPAYDYTADWSNLVRRGAVKENAKTTFQVTSTDVVSHLRLTVHPDGGIQQILAMGLPYQKENKSDKLLVIGTEATNDAASSDESVVLRDNKGSRGRKRSYRASADKATVAIQQTMVKTTRAKRRQIAA